MRRILEERALIPQEGGLLVLQLLGPSDRPVENKDRLVVKVSYHGDDDGLPEGFDLQLPLSVDLRGFFSRAEDLQALLESGVSLE